ncbi:MAG TPA: tetratricopeptide repeat protein [Longimicrobiales bacterium]|nr:tetratricopeptide repeat protein [Longimicrobiales bacterium]
MPSTLVAQAEPQVPLLEAVTGDFSRPIDTDAPLAQAYFDQGMQMVYAFTYPVAIRSFQEAQRQDPSCAMCYWGEAQARGPFLNSLMTDANAGPAFEAAQRALALIDETDDPLEKALIRAMSIRYAEEHNRETRPMLDSAYSQAMAEVYRAYPTDLDVGALYAESLMLLNTERWRYDTSDPFVQSFHGVLEGVLERDINHPGACHLYIHATEATEVAYKAEACADLLMTAIPGSSHLNHMPSHTYNVLGRWGKAVRSNAMAWRSDDRTAYGEGVSYAGTHNLHMLFYAGSMDGQGQVSAAAAEEYARQVNGGVFYHAMVLLRFGEFRDILDLTEAPSPDQSIQLGLWEFSRGYAHLRTGASDSAAVYLARVDEKARTLSDDVTMRRHKGSDLLGITGDILRGELLRSEGNLQEAISVFERAVETHDGLQYDEPEPLNFSARHWLGDALLEAGRYAEAEGVYRAALEQHPDNGWSFFGLEKALRAQGKIADADAAKADFDRVWSRADIIIDSSRL